MTDRFDKAASHADRRQSELGDDACIAMAYIDGQRACTHVAGERYDTHTVFKLASVTKIFTGVALAAAIQRGKMEYTATVATYLDGQRVPDFKGQPIRVDHLATHLSGLPREATNLGGGDHPKTRYSETEMRTFLDRYELTRPPGLEYEYSNVGYGLLGWSIGRAYGMTYSDVIDREIASPLGMSDTTTALVGNQITRLLGGSRGTDEAAVESHTEVTAGTGGLFSTVGDMMSFARAFLDPPDGELGRAIEQYVSERPNGWVYGQGGTSGFRSYFAVSRPERRGAIVLVNDFVNDPEEIGDYLMERADSLVAQELRADITDDNYLGLYCFEDGYTLVVTSTDERFEVELKGLSVKFPMREASRDRFALDGAGAIELAFVRDALGVVSSVALHQPNQPVYIATKQR